MDGFIQKEWGVTVNDFDSVDLGSPHYRGQGFGDYLIKVIMTWGLYVWTLSAPNSDCQKLRPKSFYFNKNYNR